ncbi:MAG: nodulation protein NfeD [Candidatus Hatepunaea meridiana]|nr:nodulation protein NfeD [Candidatus Hatepunaea meridiana]
MKTHTYIITIAILLLLNSTYAEVIHRIRVDGVINPVSSNFMIEAVDRAEMDGAEALIIELDTPGGLLEATRDIVQRFLAADVPIIVYVSPSGARAGSAGVFITLAAHIAVMAPGTNIGAAHPVTIGGGGVPGQQKPDSASTSVMSDKMTNDAAALVRSVAEQRDRNMEWAEKAVRESDAIIATDALENNVIDFIAVDIDRLLFKIDGLDVKLKDRQQIMETSEVRIITYEMSWRENVLNRLSDPNIAYIFMMLGMYGLIFELSNPGAIFPGVIGVICLLLAFFSFQTLPLNIVGILLILFGIILLLLEIKVTSYGILTIGGATSLFLGSLMLIDTNVPALRVSINVIIPSVIFTVAFALFAVGMGLRAQARKVTTGKEGLVGEIGEVLTDLDPTGTILVNGEYWKAEATVNIEKGQNVKVTSVDRAKLKVERSDSAE